MGRRLFLYTTYVLCVVKVVYTFVSRITRGYDVFNERRDAFAFVPDTSMACRARSAALTGSNLLRKLQAD